MLDVWVRFPNCGLWDEGLGAEWNSEQGSGNRKGGYAAHESGLLLCLDAPFAVAPCMEVEWPSIPLALAAEGAFWVFPHAREKKNLSHFTKLSRA